MKLSSSDLNADLTAAVASSLWILLALAVIVPAIACATLRQRGRSLDGGTQKAFIGARFLAIMTQMVLTIAVVAPGSRFPVASIAASLHPDYAASPAKVAALDTTLRATLNWYGAAAIIVLLVELGGVAVHCATASGDAVDLFSLVTHALGCCATLWWMLDGLHVEWLGIIVLLTCVPAACVELIAVGGAIAKEISLGIMRRNHDWEKADKERFENKGL